MCTSPWNLATELCTRHEAQESFLSLSQRENCLSSLIQDAVCRKLVSIHIQRLLGESSQANTNKTYTRAVKPGHML